MAKYLIVILFTGIFSYSSLAQTNEGTITGVIYEPNGEPAIGILVVLENTNKGDITNATGKFQIKDIPSGSYTINVSGLGFESQKKLVTINGNSQLLTIKLEENSTQLEEIMVVGKSEATELREQAYAVEVVSTKGFKNLSTNANDILNKISGVNIRQSGGLGSEFTLSLNGLSGNQVRVFLDGVPMDYFGSSLSLNNFSANLIERIEVYKGVVPIHLSSDALGGAINVVTGQRMKPYIDASYALGSFGTHIASLNAQHRLPNSGLTFRIKSFYNSSRNNYEVPVNLVNFETGKQDETPTYVNRFHDAYESQMRWFEMGFTNTVFADRLMVGILYSDNYKELQQQANAIGQAQIPYGEVATEEDKYIVNFNYSKQGLITDKLNLNAYAVGVFSESLALDTSSFRYDWFGNKELRSNPEAGEIENRKTFLTLESRNYLANSNIEYQITSNHNIAFNYSINTLNIKGFDDYKAQNNTQFSNPSDVSKQVFGMAYTNTFFSEKLKSTLFTKQYNYQINSLETDYQGIELIPFSRSRNLTGIGFSTTYQLQKIQFKASFENSVRFPEVIELFGDGLNYTPNPSLQPEKSKNYNLGTIYKPSKSVNITLNGFIRDADDFIIPQVQGIKVFHINNGKVLAKGIDLSGSWQYKEHIVFTLNTNYLDLRDNNQWRNGEVGTENSLYKIRLPNVPYFFSNLTVSYRKSSVFADNDNFSSSLTQNYVHNFFYRWENLASQDKGIVPSQWTTNLEVVYSFQSERYNLSLGITNLWDAEVYDNFQQLRPGRTYNFKIRYFIN